MHWAAWHREWGSREIEECVDYLGILTLGNAAFILRAVNFTAAKMPTNRESMTITFCPPCCGPWNGLVQTENVMGCQRCDCTYAIGFHLGEFTLRGDETEFAIEEFALWLENWQFEPISAQFYAHLMLEQMFEIRTMLQMNPPAIREGNGLSDELMLANLWNRLYPAHLRPAHV